MGTTQVHGSPSPASCAWRTLARRRSHHSLLRPHRSRTRMHTTIYILSVHTTRLSMLQLSPRGCSVFTVHRTSCITIRKHGAKPRTRCDGCDRHDKCTHTDTRANEDRGTLTAPCVVGGHSSAVIRRLQARLHKWEQGARHIHRGSGQTATAPVVRCVGTGQCTAIALLSLSRDRRGEEGAGQRACWSLLLFDRIHIGYTR